MKHDAQDLLAELEAAAAGAQECEKRYRAEAAREIERLERERVLAYRRIRLVKLIAPSDAHDEAAAVARARSALANELGWEVQSERHAPVLDRLGELARTLWATTHHGGDTRHTSQSPVAALAAFEAWYQAHAGQSFYTLFDQYVPETPLVDF